jgi:predicted ATPase
MRLRVKDFGPIKQVDIDFSKLTIIIGKNNLGKSYLAQLYYTILDCSRRVVMATRPAWDMRFEFEDSFLMTYSETKGMHEKLIEITKRMKTDNLKDSEILDCVTELVLNDLAQLMQSSLQLSLERSFGVKLSKLVNLNSNIAKIKWGILEYLDVSVQITKKSGRFRVDFSLSQRGKRRISDALESSKLLTLTRTARKLKFLHLIKLYREVQKILISKEAMKWYGRSYYIPAGRGGLLESYETVVGGLVSLSPVAPVRGLSMPPLPGMASQFYSVLLSLKGHKGPMSKAVADSFKQILQGEIQLRKAKGQPKSRLIYRFSLGKKDGSIDVIHAASMIKELAPIFLIVQELVDRGDYLIIEEPESHLHPGAQIRSANVIGDIVRNGVNVLITTHSDILLRAFGHLKGKESVERLPKSLAHRDIAIYWLKESEIGCISEVVKLSKRGTFEDIPTFDDVVRDLYETEQQLEKNAQ